MKKITVDSVAALNPCTSRFLNFKECYPKFEGTLVEFLSLDLITYNDKIWVATRLMSKKQKIRWAVACAWSVLEIYESKYSNPAPRKVLEYLDSIENADKLTDAQLETLRELRRAAYAAAAYAAYAAAADAAYAAAADAAAYAAADAAAAYAAYAAADAAAYAADADAAADAAYAADAAADAAYAAARETQQEVNLLLLVQVVQEIK